MQLAAASGQFAGAGPSELHALVQSMSAAPKSRMFRAGARIQTTLSDLIESGYMCNVHAAGYVGVALRLIGLWLVAFSLVVGPRSLDSGGAACVGPPCPCGQVEAADKPNIDCLKPAALAHGGMPCDADCPTDCPDCSCGSGPVLGVLRGVTATLPSALSSSWDWAFVDVAVNGDLSALFRPPRALS